MSPRLLLLLTAERTHRPLGRGRDRLDARRAATRTGVQLVRRHATSAPVELLAA
jgi:hypothetical protein